MSDMLARTTVSSLTRAYCPACRRVIRRQGMETLLLCDCGGKVQARIVKNTTLFVDVLTQPPPTVSYHQDNG
jgi:hypothetical protein